jgi:Rrf2 family protein
MDLNLRTHYALRALVCLALRRGLGVVTGRQIADFGGIPGKYVEQVMHDLRQAGLVHSQRGKGGGDVLAREPEAITILEVVETLEGPLDQFGRMRSGDPVEPLLEPLWIGVRKSLKEVLGTATIADAAERAATTAYYSI